MPETDPKVYVLGFLIVGAEVCLLKKKRPGWQEDKYNGVGGEVQDGGETIAEAMARECKEETGYQTNPTDWEPKVLFTFGDRTIAVFGMCRPKLDRTAMKYHPELKTGDEEVVWMNWSTIQLKRESMVKHAIWMMELCRERGLGAPITATLET